MIHPAATALAQAAQTIHAEARDHKRAESEHRRRARALMRKLDLIRRECDRLGITLPPTQTPPRRRSQ